MDLSRPKSPPLILAFCGDLFLAPPLEDAARGLGYAIRFVERPGTIGAEGTPAERAVRLTEPLDGPDAILVRYLAEAGPALLLFDLTSSSIRWERWIQVIRPEPA